MRLVSQDLKDIGLLKHWRTIRLALVKQNNLTSSSDLELIIYLHSLKRFTLKDFKAGTYTYSWEKKRWQRLVKDGWISTWRERNRTTQKYNIYKVSFKASQMISRMYRLMLGEEDLPISDKSKFYKNKTYTSKVMNKAIDDMIKDKNK
jgi:hypothetical protein|tara:strand:+ start:2476 stop:2919 length:444 start_codon:yes stop_codon:yes gene_type:complete